MGECASAGGVGCVSSGGHRVGLRRTKGRAILMSQCRQTRGSGLVVGERACERAGVCVRAVPWTAGSAAVLLAPSALALAARHGGEKLDHSTAARWRWAAGLAAGVGEAGNGVSCRYLSDCSRGHHHYTHTHTTQGRETGGYEVVRAGGRQEPWGLAAASEQEQARDSCCCCCCCCCEREGGRTASWRGMANGAESDVV